MKNIGLIYEYVQESKCKIKKESPTGFCFEINCSGNKIDGKTLYFIASKLKYILKKYPNFKLKIKLILNTIEFADKICILLLDALLYDLFMRTKYDVEIILKKGDCGSIHFSNLVGFSNSALYRTIQIKRSNCIDKETFIKEYRRPVFKGNAYRRLISKEQLEDSYTPSKILDEISTALSIVDSSSNQELDDFISSIAETVSELVCNVSSHTCDSDCLVDINFKKIDNQFLVYIGIINFSKDRLFDKLKDNIENNIYPKEDKLYSKIYEAFDFHKSQVNKQYKLEHFFMVTAFQNHVTSRFVKSGSNGTGLTTFIKSILGKTEDNYSYVLSGNQIILFKDEYLNIANNEFIGFNKENDYVNCIPEKSIIGRSSLYIPGTIYNLCLIKEIQNNE